MRPRSLDEFVGQEHLVGEGRVLRRAIDADQLPSMVFWGPPGSGKTTLAKIIASLTQSHFELVSAVASGVADLRRVVSEASDRLGEQGQRTILFIDEIHRFNKAQQDVVLPYVEDGTITLIGATTENPSFEVISPLLSRSRVFKLEPLTPEQIEGILRTALADNERGLGSMRIEVAGEALAALAGVVGGDVRIALNALELAAQTATPDADGVRHVTVEQIEEALQHRAALYDRAGDWHYDIVSAFIKSLRGSDPDAALYWLARMLAAGEDPLFVARRLVIFASEDVGNADPAALPLATSAFLAVERIGMPEGRIPLAQAVTYLACAEKSNAAYAALGRAAEAVERFGSAPVPLHLRNAPTPLMKELGYGRDYRYPHDAPDAFVPDRNLPDVLGEARFYEPKPIGTEQDFERRLALWRKRRKDQEKPG
jgi:putative ATPase